MPPELDRMVEEGIWLPSTDEQRNALLEAAEERGMTRLVPRLLARLALHPTMTLRVSGWLSAYDTTYQDVIDEHLRTRDAGLRAIAARSAGHASLSEWITRLRDLSRDDNPAVRLEALIARVRSGDAKAIPPLRGIFLSDRDQSSDGIRNRAMELMLDAHDSRVLDVASGIYTESPSDWERACLASILLESGRSANTALVRNALQGGLRPDFWHLHMIQALGHSSLSVDRVFLEDQYPSQGAVELNIALTQALLRAGSEEVLPVLRHAIWKGDLNRSFLAAALLGARFGDLRLMQWIERPPESATEQDLRRVGFLIGSLGGMEAVETLAGHLGAVVGVDRPELQGAMLGALSARTY
ncbi:MAG: HEAT repeat domain-containing protein [Planctomycetota bacterium]